MWLGLSHGEVAALAGCIALLEKDDRPLAEKPTTPAHEQPPPLAQCGGRGQEFGAGAGLERGGGGGAAEEKAEAAAVALLSPEEALRLLGSVPVAQAAAAPQASEANPAGELLGCSACTFHNPLASQECRMCGASLDTASGPEGGLYCELEGGVAEGGAAEGGAAKGGAAEGGAAHAERSRANGPGSTSGSLGFGGFGDDLECALTERSRAAVHARWVGPRSRQGRRQGGGWEEEEEVVEVEVLAPAGAVSRQWRGEARQPPLARPWRLRSD